MNLLSRFNDLKISFKLILGYAVVGFLLVVGTAVGLTTTAFIKDLADRVNIDHVVTDNKVVLIMQSGYRIHSDLSWSLLDAAHAKTSLNTLSTATVEVNQLFAELKKSELDPEQVLKLTALQSDWLAYQQLASAYITKAQAGTVDTASLSGDSELENRWTAFETAGADWRAANYQLASAHTASTQSYFNLLVVFLVGAGLLGVVISQGVGFFVARSITKPLKAVTQHLRQLSVGQSGTSLEGSEQLLARKDELGQLARDLDDVDDYIQSVAVAAGKIAEGDLTVQVSPRGADDQMGHALARMVEQLAELVRKVVSSSGKVGDSSSQLVDAARETRAAAGQITTTILQVAQGTNRQSVDMNEAMGAIEKTNQSIRQVAKGVGEQSQAVEDTTLTAVKMEEAIQKMIRNVDAVSKAAETSSSRAADGAGTLRQTVSSMKEIGEQVELLDGKMAAVGERSAEISSITEAIEEIASTTNILAINASIEAVHAEVQAKKLTEEILNQMMIAQVQMVNQMLLDGAASRDQAFWVKLCAATNLDTILVTDEDGVTVHCNEVNLLGWRFPEDPKAQAFPFRSLIQQKDGVVCQESQLRSIDHMPFKYCGASRADQPGIVQVGFSMLNLKRFDLQVSGFAVVASEVYQLAERARLSTGEIRTLVKGIQSSVTEAVTAMRRSRSEAQAGLERAGSAGAALEQILSAVGLVSTQAHQALEAAGQMQALARSLADNVDTFGRVVDGNYQAVSEMQSGYTRIAQTMENIASLSEENSAATEEVSASSEQMRAEMEEVNTAAEELAEMAVSLQQLVARFRYDGGDLLEDLPEKAKARHGLLNKALRQAK